jgi:DNA mismatch repair protein MutS
LFSAQHKSSTLPTKSDVIKEQLAKIIPDELSPREALDVLYDLKKRAMAAEEQ